MGLQKRDLIHVPFDESLTLAGVTYACRTLGHVTRGGDRPTTDHLRRLVVHTAGELALRRWMEREGVDYGLLRADPLTRPEHYSLTLGGRLLEARTAFLTPARMARRLATDPSWLLAEEVRLPVEALDSERMGPGDLYAFVVAAGLEARTSASTRKALAAGRRAFLLATPPGKAWSHPRPSKPLGRVYLENRTSEETHLVVGVRLPDRLQRRVHLSLAPSATAELEFEPQGLLYLQTSRPPEGALFVGSAVRQRPWRVNPSDWHNLWVYGERIVLVGWLTKAGFARLAGPSSAGVRAPLWAGSRESGHAVRISRLRPMRDLIVRLTQI